MEHNICKLKDIYHMLYAYEKKFNEENKITVNEAMVLCFLSDGKDRTAGELCAHVGLSNSRVSKIINDMEKKAYIFRRMGEADKRHMFFQLTPNGQEKYNQLKGIPFDLSLLHNQIVACF